MLEQVRVLLGCVKSKRPEKGAVPMRRRFRCMEVNAEEAIQAGISGDLMELMIRYRISSISSMGSSNDQVHFSGGTAR